MEEEEAEPTLDESLSDKSEAEPTLDESLSDKSESETTLDESLSDKSESETTLDETLSDKSDSSEAGGQPCSEDHSQLDEASKPASTEEAEGIQANSDDDDDDEEEDPDFDPTLSTVTPQENVSEEESDGDDEENVEAANRITRNSAPMLQESRKRPSSVSFKDANGSLDHKSWKAPKLISGNSTRKVTIPASIPRTRITFLSGKAADIGLSDLRKTGLGGVLAALRSHKQTKLTTLEKSRMDWQAFKKAEGLEDELKNQMKSRHGFLEKRAFLQRTDLRRYVIEKSMRSKLRRNP